MKPSMRELVGVVAFATTILGVVGLMVSSTRETREEQMVKAERFCMDQGMDPVYEFYAGKPFVKMCVKPGTMLHGGER